MSDAKQIGSGMTHSDAGEPILRRLSAGTANPVLVADFQQMSMAPRLSEMLSGCVQDQPVFQIDPVGALSGTRLYASLPELATACADEFLNSGTDHGRVYVVGHCSAAALSLRVADLLASTYSVTAVLVGPSWPDDEHVARMFAEFLAKFGPAARPCPDLDADPCLVVSAMEQIFRDQIIALAASRGLSGSVGAFLDLLGWYRAWLAFLLACRNDTSPSALTIAGPPKDAYRVLELPASQQAGAVTRELAELVAAHVAPH